ncbi:Replication protein A 70 kDa DNA-binding subunit B [Bienertia sinuspersici]
MKKEYNYLDELTDKSRNFKVKVTVTHKHDLNSLLERKNGNTMRGAIFEDDIQTFNDAIQRNKQYEISDAIIQPVPEQYQMNQNKYQMNFNERMTLIPLTDVSGIVLFVGETRLVPINGSDVPVPWDDLVENESELFKKWSSSFIVAGFTAMRIKAYKGFSLGSTMSTEILVNPTNEKAEKLQLWACQNETLLRDCQSVIMESRNPSPQRIISTAAEINAKKATSTWLEKKFWLKVTMTEATLDDLYFYLGCSKCGRKGDAKKGALITFKFKAVDATGTRKFTIFTREVETLFDLTSDQMHEMKYSDNATMLKEKIEQFHTTEIYLQVGPTNTLTTSQMLSWVFPPFVHYEATKCVA